MPDLPPDGQPGFIDVGAQRLRVAVRPGRPAGVPLLLINGLGAELSVLDPLVAALPAGLTVIRFDVPGVGGSPDPARWYRFGGLCELIAGLLDELGHDQADVLGLSWGGGAAQHFAWSQPDRCRRLILASAGSGWTMVPAPPLVLAWLLTPMRWLAPGLAELVAPGLYGGSARTNPVAAVAAMRGERRRSQADGPGSGPQGPDLLRGPGGGSWYQLAAGAGWTSLPYLPLLAQPTLILSGTDDPIIPVANACQLAAMIRRSRLHLYRGGHLGLITEAAELAPVVAAFLTAADPAAAARRAA